MHEYARIGMETYGYAWICIDMQKICKDMQGLPWMIREERVPKGKQIWKPERRLFKNISSANAKTGKLWLRREEWMPKGRQT